MPTSTAFKRANKMSNNDTEWQRLGPIGQLILRLLYVSAALPLLPFVAFAGPKKAIQFFDAKQVLYPNQS